ncbi:hypothetical protein AB0L99_42540 [Streptomyces sp. NPDC051954]|uniref:hypothetical protein n=1 Tax=Streptomyces sp. NPDC051954 TaxID=3155524 RepID=UPI0034147CDF
MPLGTPQGPSQSAWTLSVGSVAQVGEYAVRFDVTAVADNPDDPGMAPIVQQLVDLLEASPNFQLYSATRTYSYSEQMTPTA